MFCTNLVVNNKRVQALPLDWLFISPNSVRHMIETDFAYLHDQFYIAKTDWCLQPCSQHTFYHAMDTAYSVDFKDKHVFNHHDLTDPQVLETSERRTKRLLKIIFGHKSKLFVMTSLPLDNKDVEYVKFQNACTEVYLSACSKYENFDFVCVFLHDGPTVPCGSITKKERTKLSFWKARNTDFIK